MISVLQLVSSNIISLTTAFNRWQLKCHYDSLVNVFVHSLSLVEIQIFHSGTYDFPFPININNFNKPVLFKVQQDNFKMILRDIRLI
jgi:hypothetical protein